MEKPNASKQMDNVLTAVFGGEHHWPPVHKHNEGTQGEYWEVNTTRNLATSNPDHLTLLVVAAHDQCVRVNLMMSGPGMVKIRMSPRRRKGPYYEAHPDMETAVRACRIKSPEPWTA